MANPKLRVGIIGTGYIGTVHAEHYQKCDDVDVVAACDIDPAHLAKCCDLYKIKRRYESWPAMLRDGGLDAVSVCTPNALHLQPTLDALASGCHVLVEKPMAMNAGECQRMIDASAKFKKHLTVGFQHRFQGRTQVLKRAFDEGVFGKVLFMRVQVLRRRGIPNWGVFGQKALQGGGPLIDIGVHVLETAHYIIGSPEPLAASGHLWTYLGNKPSTTFCQWPGWDDKTYDVEDLAVGSIRLQGGTVIHLESSFAAHVEKDVWTFQLMGEKGGATWDPTTLFFDHGGTMLNATPAFVPQTDFFAAKMRNFVDVCLHDRPDAAPAAHGLRVQKMLDALYASAAAGREVAIG